MSKKNRTVSEVLAEMEDIICRVHITSPVVADMLLRLKEEALAAHKREMAAKDARIALLERALKPVMNCLHYDVSKATKAMVTYDEGNEEVLGEFFDKDGATVITESEINNIFKAVMETQRIMKEGESK